MSVKCQTIIDAVHELAPLHLAESWDNVGLLVGCADQAINKILVALDVTPELALRATNEGVDMIIAHHPLIFEPLTSIRTDQPLGRTLASLIKADIALLAVHTNLDAAAKGVNDVLADRLGLRGKRPLVVSQQEKLLKLVVFVPASHSEEVRAAITGAGAGHIGNYSDCTFQTTGTGTFLPLPGTSPFTGQQGKLEYAPEIRLETILPATLSRKVVGAMLQAHPYEEVAYDLYPLENQSPATGLGRLGELAETMTFGEFAAKVKIALQADHVRAVGDSRRLVKIVAVCGGAGASVISQAAAAGADVLVTGDVKYHEAQAAQQMGLAVIDAGHFATERPAVDGIASYLKDCAARGDWSVTINTDILSKDVFQVY
ncbi:MAG: Nif3-like dinuclear metal center hexameric protein [Negativicutes bacterium]|nr:Nif3-like dinuclear metal center hexameric protein [Negativicutes bacterium]